MLRFSFCEVVRRLNAASFIRFVSWLVTWSVLTRWGVVTGAPGRAPVGVLVVDRGAAAGAGGGRAGGGRAGAGTVRGGQVVCGGTRLVADGRRAAGVGLQPGCLTLGGGEVALPPLLHRADQAAADADDDDAAHGGEDRDEDRGRDRGGHADLVERGDDTEEDDEGRGDVDRRRRRR